jgi:PAS domain S-box-containing protein
VAILIVDDDSESRTLLKSILTAESLDVRAADGGDLALAAIAVEKPELILLDIRMPRMDGFEVCRRLKHGAGTRDIPVVFLTASGELSEKVEGLGLGAVDFITKPFQREELLARVRTHLELARLRADLENRVAERTAELRESEDRFRAMADVAPVMIWVSTADKRRNFFNKRWLDFTGRSAHAEMGHGWMENVHPDDIERCSALYFSAVDERRTFETEYRLRRADGQYQWVLERGVPRPTPSGVFAGYVGSCTDITDLKQNHERMLASQKLESLGLMAAGVALDFGNLLGTIFGEVDLALSEMSAKTPGRQNIERIAAAATRSTGTVKLLRISAGVGGDSSASELVNLSFFVEEMLRLLTVSLPRQIVFRSKLTKDLPPLRGNVAQIRQVIMNLITNALEAIGGQQGTITVSTDKVAIDPGSTFIDSANIPQGEYVRLIVADSGPGMTAETRARIFDQFFTTKSEGRGLGLSVVHGIVRSHGGGIQVASQPGKGSTFEVLFPCGYPVAQSGS